MFLITCCTFWKRIKWCFPKIPLNQAFPWYGQVYLPLETWGMPKGAFRSVQSSSGHRCPCWPSVSVPQPGTGIPFQSCPLQVPDLRAQKRARQWLAVDYSQLTAKTTKFHSFSSRQHWTPLGLWERVASPRWPGNRLADWAEFIFPPEYRDKYLQIEWNWCKWSYSISSGLTQSL